MKPEMWAINFTAQEYDTILKALEIYEMHCKNVFDPENYTVDQAKLDLIEHIVSKIDAR